MKKGAGLWIRDACVMQMLKCIDINSMPLCSSSEKCSREDHTCFTELLPVYCGGFFNTEETRLHVALTRKPESVNCSFE